MIRIVLLLTVGTIVHAQAQTDAEWRKQVDRELLKEEPQSALFSINRIANKSSEDKLREVETQSLRPGSLSPDLTNMFVKSDPVRKSPYFAYISAQMEFQKRNFIPALSGVQAARKKSISASLRTKAEFLAGKIFLELNKTDSAMACFESALSEFQKDSVDSYIQIAKVRNFLGRALRRKGKLEEAVQQYRIAATILSYSPLEKWDDLARIYNNTGIAYGDLGVYNLAQENYLKSSALKDKHSTDSLNRATTYANLASFYSDYGNYLKSQEYHRKTISLIDTTKTTSQQLLASYCNNYGVMLMAMREYATAAHYFQKSIQLLNDLHAQSLELLTPSLNLSICLDKAGAKVKARKVLGQWDSLVRTLPAKDLRVFEYWSISGNIELEEDQPKAEECFQRAKVSLETSAKPPPRKYAEVLEALGSIDMRKAKPDKASVLFASALKEVQKEDVPDQGTISQLYNSLGMALSARQMTDSAYYFFNQALKANTYPEGKTSSLASSKNLFANPFELIVSHYQLAKLHWESFGSTRNTEELQKIVPSIEAAMEMIRLERDEMTTGKDKISLGIDAAAVYDLAIQTYYQLYVKTGKKEYQSSLFVAIERAKQQVMMSTLRMDKIEAFSGVTRQVTGYEKDLNYKVEHLTAQLSGELGLGPNASPDLVLEYDGALASAQKRFKNLTDSLKDFLPDYYNLKYSNTITNPEALQQDVIAGNPGKVILQFHVADTSIIILITHYKGSTAISVPAREVNRMLTSIRTQIRYSQPEWKTTSAMLYDRLYKPVEKVLAASSINVKELVVIPDGELFFLPFEVLMRNDKSPLLIEQLEVQYALSATLLWQKTTDKRHKETVTAAGGFIGYVPTFEQDGKRAQYSLREGDESLLSFGELESTSIEVNGIAKVLGKANIPVKVVEGDNASEGNFKQSRPSAYRYVHLATHGFVNMEEPDRSGLAFSKVGNEEDNILFSSEVYNVKLNADLVCLSACETGLGKIYRGEGLMGFTRGFFYAGARNIVVSLWRVEDKSTSDWMIAFYSQLAKGKSNATSVRKAKLELLKSKTYNHPYYWAPFILIGG